MCIFFPFLFIHRDCYIVHCSLLLLVCLLSQSITIFVFVWGQYSLPDVSPKSKISYSTIMFLLDSSSNNTFMFFNSSSNITHMYLLDQSSNNTLLFFLNSSSNSTLMYLLDPSSIAPLSLYRTVHQ